MRLSDLEVGKKVVVLTLGDNIMRVPHQNDQVLTAQVTKIGRKYVTVMTDDSPRLELKFDHTADFREFVVVGSPHHELFLTKEDVMKEQEKMKLIQQFNRMPLLSKLSRLSVEELKQIMAMLSK